MAKAPEYGTTGKPHPFHILPPSVWPLVTSFASLILAAGALMYMHDVQISGRPVGLMGVYLGFAAVLFCMFMWWKDIIYEAVTEKAHTIIAKIGFRFGMMLFIMSELMFFVAFFWAFFNASLFPTEAINFMWPPENIHPVGAFGLPFMMTLILLLSGCSATWAHHAILEGHQKEFIQALGITVLLGAIFLCFQVYEYTHLSYGFKDGIFASTFYMATGFQGFHVLVGTVFLLVCYLRAKKGHFTKDSHFGFEAAAWYWHFVDVVWLFLFVAVYWWGAGGVDAAAH